MHAEAFQWVAQWATHGPVAVLDIGGRDINGSPRSLFPGAGPYRVLDIAPGPGVEIVADAADWAPDQEYDVVVCTEVFEHTARWPEICATVHKALNPGGLFIATMAGPGRPVHSAVDGGWQLHPGEYYGNVDPRELDRVLAEVGFQDAVIDVRTSPADVRAVARK
jgi:SAM-dependent methyltransferase